jgi:hypothetical protein
VAGEASKAVATVVDAEGVATKRCCTLDVALDSDMLSGETASQVLDPASDWVLSSPSGDGRLGAQAAPNPTDGTQVTKSTAGGPAVADEVGLVQVGVVPSTARGRRTKTILVDDEGGSVSGAKSVRKSARHKGTTASKPVMERAQRRAAVKNLETGTFTTLDSLSDDHLSSVAADSCVVFTPAAGTPVEAISLIREKERVQAALAAAAFRKEQELAACAAREAAQPSSTGGEGPFSADSAESPVGEARTAGEAVAHLPTEASPNGQGADPRKVSRATRPRRATLAVRKGRGKRKAAK